MLPCHNQHGWQQHHHHCSSSNDMSRGTVTTPIFRKSFYFVCILLNLNKIYRYNRPPISTHQPSISAHQPLFGHHHLFGRPQCTYFGTTTKFNLPSAHFDPSTIHFGPPTTVWPPPPVQITHPPPCDDDSRQRRQLEGR